MKRDVGVARRIGTWVALGLAAGMASSGWAKPLAAQTDYRVQGTVVDSTGAGLANAMVVALSRADSVLVTYALADDEGRFLLRDLVAGDYILQITSMGHFTVRQDFAVVDQDVDAGTIRMRVSAVELDPLVVSADQVPFVNRRDTLDYNAAAFQVRPNATVEELLARLPGVTVEDDGTIIAQGEEVSQVLVDGKEFFGGDPTIATRNLPADAVERVQIYDRRSDMAEFTGIEDGEEERTVNLELHEDARNGFFGNVSGAVGGEQGGTPPVGPEADNQLRYQQSFAVNRFSPRTQTALLGGMNNINEAGFSWGDIQGGGRGGNLGGGRNDGFTETKALGTNLSFNPSNDRWIRTSYFFNDLENVVDQLVSRQQLLGSQVASTLDQTTAQTTENQSHRLNLNAQYQFAEGHDMRLRGSLNASSSASAQARVQTTLAPNRVLINTATSGNETEGDDLSGNLRLTWRKRLNESGRSLVFEAQGNLSDRDGATDVSTSVGSLAVGDVLTYDETLQQRTQDNRQLTESQRLALTQPLGGSKVLELYAERRTTSEDRAQSVFDVSGDAPVFDDLLSSELDQTYRYLGGGLRLSRNSEKAFLTLGAEVQRSELDGRILDRDERVVRDYVFVLPSANFRYEIRDGWNVSARYTTSSREPDTEELQPFTDNTDPLNLYTGNPELRPEYRHTLSLDQRYFDPFTFRNVFAYARLSYTIDDIAQARVTDGRGVQQVTPVNSADAWSTSAGIDFSEPVRRIGAELNLGYDFTYSRSTQLLNLEQNETRIMRNGLGLSLENRRKTNYSVEGGIRLNFNDVRYSLSEGQNQAYVNTTLSGEAEWYPGGNWTLSTSISHQMFDEEAFGDQEDVTLWQASISRLFLDGRGELQLVAFDLLDQNQGVSFTNSANFVQESRTASLGRHLMLRLVYRLGQVGAGGRRGPGMRDGRVRG
jgi:hypothetical protein